jgi:ABC-type branched-subunit amino acid transport system substrate-binding protein
MIDMRRKRPGIFVWCVVLLLSLSTQNLSGQTKSDSIAFRGDVEKDFVEAMRFFSVQKFDTAAIMFSRSMKEYPRSHRTTGTYIMCAKAYYRIGNYRDSIRLLKDLLDLFPESDYADDAHYTLGLDYYRSFRYEDAAQQFLLTRQNSKDPKLIARSEKMLDLLATAHLTIAQLQMLSGEASAAATKAIINYALAEKIFRAGEAKDAQTILRTIVSLSPQTRYVAEALALLNRIEKGGVLKVGVAIPLMLKTPAAASKPAMELLDGVKFAVDEYNVDATPKIQLEIRDTESDPGIASRAVSELCSDDNTIAIIGPMFSDEVYAAAGVANTKGVPLITPTATRNGIAAMGPFVFQSNPDYETRGRAMARYAFDQRKARRFAVLAPKGAVGELMADAFIDEVKRLGGELVDIQWYFAGSNDMRTQLMSMRKKALERVEVTIVDFAAKMKQAALTKMERWGVPPRILDSLIERNATATVTSLFGPSGKDIADSLGVPTVLLPIKYDSLAIPVENIDAFFVPIATSDEIGVVASQVRYYNFQTLLLGTEDWNELSDLDENRRYTDGIVFATDSYTSIESQAYRNFVVKFQKAYNKAPGKYSLVGYDAMRVLQQAIQKGSLRRNDIANALPATRNFYGLHSTISFSDRRVNSFLTILQFKNRAISKIGEIDLSTSPKPSQ